MHIFQLEKRELCNKHIYIGNEMNCFLRMSCGGWRPGGEGWSHPNNSFIIDTHFLCRISCFKKPLDCVLHVHKPLPHIHLLHYLLLEIGQEMVTCEYRSKLHKLLLELAQLCFFIRLTLLDLDRSRELRCNLSFKPKFSKFPSFRVKWLWSSSTKQNLYVCLTLVLKFFLIWNQQKLHLISKIHWYAPS